MFADFSLRTILTLFSIVIAATLLCYTLPSIAPPLKVAENWIADFRIAVLTKTQEYDDRVVVVTIDEKTLQKFPYRSPVDRGFLADVIEKIVNAGAKAIALDILLDTPTEEAKDQQLKAALDSMSIPFISAYATPSGSGGRLNQQQLEFLDRFTENTQRGFANVITDPEDQVVRDIFPGWTDPETNQFYPGMAQLLASAAGIEQLSRETKPLDYRGRPVDDVYGIRRIPAANILVKGTELFHKAWFKDKLVLIGADLTDIDLDLKRTPWHTIPGEKNEGYFPGVMIHAYATSQLLDSREFANISELADIALIITLTLIGALFGRAALNIFLLGLVVATTVILYWALGFMLFYYEIGPLIPVVFPTMAFIIGLAASIALFGNEERAQKKFIKDAFSRYLSPALVGQLVDNPDTLKIQGEKRELSFIFTDVAGFTSFTEAVEPELLVQVLNEYLEGMCANILEHNGTIDKFIGDAVFVIFGAPLTDVEHAGNAVRCALALDDYANEFQKRMSSIGVPFGKTRIGVHTGLATVGNFGSETRFEYTALGDAVNAAARLESLNKQFGTTTAISGDTVAKSKQWIGDEVDFRPIASVIVKGKTEPIDIYMPLTKEEAGSAMIREYKAAFELMSKGSPDSGAAFDQLRSAYPGDQLIKLHTQRLKTLEVPTHLMKLDEK